MSADMIKIFENVSVAGTSKIIFVDEADFLQLDISGTASSFKININAQVVENGEYLPIAVIGNKDFKIYNSIEENGFYQINTTGILNIEIELTNVVDGVVNCDGSLDVSSQEERTNIEELQVQNTNQEADILTLKERADGFDNEIASLNNRADNLNTKIDTVDEKIDEKTTEVTKTANNSFANAVKSKAIGSVVHVDDVSPVEHEVDVRVRNKNLLKPLYTEITTSDGIIITPNSDGSVNLNGVATVTTSILFSSRVTPMQLQRGTYTVSMGIEMLSNCYCYIEEYNGAAGGWKSQLGRITEGNNSATFTLDEPAYVGGYLRIPSGTIIENITIYPQIELGLTPTEYTPYVDPSTVTVSRYGKNLIPYPYANTTKTVNGITFTDNGDGSITANGTATSDALMQLRTIQNPISFPAGTYTVSSGVSNDDAAKTYGLTVGVKIDEQRGTQYSKNGYNTFTIDKNADIDFIVIIRSGQTVTNLTFYPQLEFGSTTTTEYEQYVETVEYTPNADGTVEGVTSLAPTMTLIPDKAGVTLELDYNKDVYNVIEDEIDKSAKTANNSFANAVKGKASGSIVRVDDVSPIEHEIDVKVSSKNLIPYPYKSNNVPPSANGLTVKIDVDGTITVSGTANSHVFLKPATSLYLPKGTYCLSGCPSGGGSSTYRMYIDHSGGTVVAIDTGDGATFTLTEETNINVQILIYPNIQFENLVFKPQIERGTNKTNYTPYLVDPSTVKVIRSGKNMLVNKTGNDTIKSIGWTVNEDGTLNASGTIGVDISDYYFFGGSVENEDSFVAPLDLILSTNYEIDNNNVFGARTSAGLIHITTNANNIIIPAGTRVDGVFLRAYNKTINQQNIECQMEIGTIKTAYEPCNWQSALADADGTIDGLKSNSPYMLLWTNKTGVIIDSIYNKDVYNVIEDEIDKSAKTANNSFANAVKGKASGSIVRVDDVSPVEHDVDIKVSSKNLVNIPVVTKESKNAWVSIKIATLSLPSGVYTFSADYVQEGDLTTVGAGAREYNSIVVSYGDCRISSASGRMTMKITIPDGINTFDLHVYSNASANVLNSKCTFSNIQVEKGSVATEYTPYVDPSTVTVVRYGKNLIPYPYLYRSRTIDGVTFTVNNDGTIILNGTATATIYFSILGTNSNRIYLPKGTSYILSSGITEGYHMALGYDYGTAETPSTVNWINDSVHSSFTPTDDAYIQSCSLIIDEGYTFNNVVVKPQLEIGNIVTEFESPNGEAYVSNSDGTVDGITSLTPIMTLLPDKADVNLEVNYNKDTNKVIESLINAIISLGGNV